MKSIVSGSIKGESEKAHNIRYSRIIEFLLLIFLTLLICCPTIFLISKYYADFVWFLYGTENKPVQENHKLELLYNILKGISPLVFVWMIIIWYDFFNHKKRKSIILIQKVSETISFSLTENRAFFYSLKKETRFTVAMFFSILFVAVLYFLLAIPLQYDEWFSYSFFTRPGFWTTLSSYSTTNNHIFSNLITCIFTKLPFDAEVTMRLPNLIITPICIWYFFKICKYCFSDTISIILLVFVICPYPIVMYAFAARGYMAVNLFCILMMYSSIHLCENYQNKKYRILFILSLFLGTFSMPTFIYAAFSVCIVLGIYVIKQKILQNVFLFIKDGLISAALTFFSYSFVLMFNNLDSMMGLNGFSTKFSLSEPGAFEKIITHLKNVCAYLFFYEDFLMVICVLIVLSTAFYLFRAKSKPFFICILSATMFFSPFLILILQRVIPFERNWLFLIFPSALCFGFIIHNLVNIRALHFFVEFIARHKLTINALILSLAIFSFSRFTAKHANYAFIDFEIHELRQRHLNAVMRNINEISMTKKSHEYQAADIIWYMCLKEDPKRKVLINELTEIKNQELLIIDKTEVERFKEQLSSYKFLIELDSKIYVYGRAGLF